MSAECKAKCDAKVQANAECTPPHVALRIVGAADATAAAKFQAALEKNLPGVLKVAIGMGKHVDEIAGSIKVVVEGVQGERARARGDAHDGGSLTACVAAPFKGALDAAASVQANVKRVGQRPGERLGQRQRGRQGRRLDRESGRCSRRGRSREGRPWLLCTLALRDEHRADAARLGHLARELAAREPADDVDGAHALGDRGERLLELGDHPLGDDAVGDGLLALGDRQRARCASAGSRDVAQHAGHVGDEDERLARRARRRAGWRRCRR